MANLEKLKNSVCELKIPTINPIADGLSAGIGVIDEMNAISSYPTISVDVQNSVYKSVLGEMEEAKTTQEDEEWIWVDGYKGTQSDMRCNEYQYELGKQFDMPEGVPIEDCKSGFHFCLNLRDVFDYYRIGEGRRFFKVSALVRKKDFENYGKPTNESGGFGFWYHIPNRNKLAAKSIIFTKELTPDEIFKDTQWAARDGEFKKIALAESPCAAENSWMVKKLVGFGYSEPLAKQLLDNDDHSEKEMYEFACALETQPGISIDTKIIAMSAR